jgi:hypothetical protein
LLPSPEVVWKSADEWSAADEKRAIAAAAIIEACRVADKGGMPHA